MVGFFCVVFFFFVVLVFRGRGERGGGVNDELPVMVMYAYWYSNSETESITNLQLKVSAYRTSTSLRVLDVRIQPDVLIIAF